MNLFKKPIIQVSHTVFSILFIVLLFTVFNAVNYDKTLQWFIIKDEVNYAGLIALYIFGVNASLAVFVLFAHRFITKPLAITFIALSAAASYFIAKYNVAIERSMIVNVLHTDAIEISGLLSIYMTPYLIFLVILPLFILSRIQIIFKPFKNHLTRFLLVFVIAISIAVASFYAQHKNLIRATNISQQRVLQTLIPINLIGGISSVVERAVKPFFRQNKKPVNITGKITKQEDLIVVLVIGESTRQKNLSLYGYQRKNTNPKLSRYQNLHRLNGISQQGYTIHALAEILTKNDIKLTEITSKLGVKTNCYVNFSLYENCGLIGEINVSNCSHNGICYDEDVVALLEGALKNYQSGYQFSVLHLGGGSHGPIYQKRYPEEFQIFKPQCLEANVLNHCTKEELYNSYDNSVLYLDYVLDKIITELDKTNKPYVFIYLSDHGESLMEEGRIFHGMPPGLALPDEQAKIPLIIRSSIPISIEKRVKYKQQDIFDTVLDLLSIETPLIPEKNGFIKK